MYSLLAYGDFIADKIRTGAYQQALGAVVTPDSVVLDIGTGTGILALLACQYGARRVYAIEPSDAIQLGREMAAANGYANKIEFIQDVSSNVSLSEQADVLVSDLHGILPLFGKHIPTIIDARQRLLKRGSKLIPCRETLWMAPVDAPERYRAISNWDGDFLGLDLGLGRRAATNHFWKVRLNPEQLLATPKCWATLDYSQIESPDVVGEVEIEVERPGTSYGLSVWFDSTLAEGISFSNGPEMPETIYGNLFFPWTRPVPVNAGDMIRVKVKAHLIGDDYLYSWESAVLDHKLSENLKADFKQSTFFGATLSPASLRKRAASYIPSLNDEGEIDHFVLARMDGKTPSEQIAQQLAELFPNRFANVVDALTQVGELTVKYGK